MRSFAASHQDITVSYFSFVIHSVLLKLCMCVFLTKNKRTILCSGIHFYSEAIGKRTNSTLKTALVALL